jgi:hypothetical protein
MLNIARRARLIPMSAIRDDGSERDEPFARDGVDAWLDMARGLAEDYRRDRTEGQKTLLMVVCEARGMVPNFENAQFGRRVELEARQPRQADPAVSGGKA